MMRWNFRGHPRGTPLRRRTGILLPRARAPRCRRSSWKFSMALVLVCLNLTFSFDSGDQAVGTDQSQKEVGLDVEGHKTHLAEFAKEMPRNNLVVALQSEGPGIVGNLQNEDFVVVGILNLRLPGSKPWIIISDRICLLSSGLYLSVKDGPQSIGIESAKECIPSLLLLLDPVVQILRLEILRNIFPNR